MRRTDREITDKTEIRDIIRKSKVCKLAMCNGERPYLVPMCFGFKDDTLFFHSATRGKKIDILKKNPHVCFEFEALTQVIKSAKACRWGMKYQSVIGYGKVEFVEDAGAKREAFDIIMKQYADGTFSYEDAAIESTVVLKVKIQSMTGKKSEI